MTQKSDDPVEFLCWFDGSTNDKSAMIAAATAEEAATLYRKQYPDNRLCVYVRECKTGPLHWFLT